MCKGVLADHSLVGLNGHIHERTYQSRRGPDLGSVDIGSNWHRCLVALDNHGNLFERSVACTLADTIDGYLHLSCTIDYTGDGIGCGHAQIVVTMSRKDSMSILQSLDMIHKVFDLLTVFPRHTIACGVGDIDDGGACLDGCVDYFGKIFVFGATSVFGIELHFVDLVAGVSDGGNRTLDDFFACGVELILDVRIRSAYAGVDSLVLGILQCFGSAVDVLLYRTCKCTNGRPSNGFGYFDDGIEVARARNGETGFNDIYAQLLEGLSHLDLLHGVQLTAWNLFSVTQRRVEDK